jgi:DinB superfamily
MSIQKPIPGEYPAYYENYYKLIDMDKSVLDQMHEDAEKFGRIITLIPKEKWHYAYAHGKWSVLSLIQHIIDTERIMTYRALCFARGEKQMLPGFNENEYAAAADMQHKSTGVLSLEWMSVRQATLSFYLSLSAEEGMRKGSANTNVASVNAIAYVTLGHARHHFQILEERYIGVQ